MNGRRGLDWFLILAIAQIVLGLVIVVAALVFWFITGRQSQLFVGAGLTLAIGAGIQKVLAGIGVRMPDYDREADPLEPDRRPSSRSERRSRR